jgi:hypothetical protein
MRLGPTRHGQRDCGAMTFQLRDQWARRELRRLPIYQDSMRPLGTHDQLAISLTAGGTGLVALGITRVDHGFTKDDRQLLTWLAGPLRQLYRAARCRDPAEHHLPSCATDAGSTYGRALTRRPIVGWRLSGHAAEAGCLRGTRCYLPSAGFADLCALSGHLVRPGAGGCLCRRARSAEADGLERVRGAQTHHVR